MSDKNEKCNKCKRQVRERNVRTNFSYPHFHYADRNTPRRASVCIDCFIRLCGGSFHDWQAARGLTAKLYPQFWTESGMNAAVLCIFNLDVRRRTLRFCRKLLHDWEGF